MNKGATDMVYPSVEHARTRDRVFGAYFNRRYAGVKRILIASPHRARGDSLVINPRLLQCSPTMMWEGYEPCGMTVAQARTECVCFAKRGGFTHIFFIDDDVIIPRDTLLKLASHDADIVGGVYCQKQEPVESFIKRVVTDPSGGPDIVTPLPFDQYAIGDIIQNALFVPGGCMLINTQVFDRITRPWFQTARIVGHGVIGDDEYFSQKARLVPYNLIIDTGVQCIHVDKRTGKKYGHPGVIDMATQRIFNPENYCLGGRVGV